MAIVKLHGKFNINIFCPATFALRKIFNEPQSNVQMDQRKYNQPFLKLSCCRTFLHEIQSQHSFTSESEINILDNFKDIQGDNLDSYSVNLLTLNK